MASGVATTVVVIPKSLALSPGTCAATGSPRSRGSLMTANSPAAVGAQKQPSSPVKEPKLIKASSPALSPSTDSVSRSLAQSLSQLPVSTLTELCSRLRLQLIQQRLPLLCAACQPTILRAANMELNLTQMLRSLCKHCRHTFAGPSLIGGEKDDGTLISFATASSLASLHSSSSLSSLSSFSLGPSPVPSPPPAIAAPPRKHKVAPLLPRKAVLAVPATGNNLAPKILRLRGPRLESVELEAPLYELLIETNRDWCRYCGAVSAKEWLDGPWGAHSLCGTHGRAYQRRHYSNNANFGRHSMQGALFLDLAPYEQESKEQRRQPVTQSTCIRCFQPFRPGDRFVACAGCPLAFHHRCIMVGNRTSLPPPPPPPSSSDEAPLLWFCGQSCRERLETFQREVNAFRQRQSLQQFSNGGRFAKRLSMPLSPPASLSSSGSEEADTHPAAKRKRKSWAGTGGNQQSDLLVCFDATAVLRSSFMQSREKTSVLVPNFETIPFPVDQQSGTSPVDEVIPSDLDMLVRHQRLEAAEKDHRLLRPAVLERFFNISPANSDNSISLEVPALTTDDPRPIRRRKINK